MAPELFKSMSRSAQQDYTAQASSRRASPALPVAGRRGGRQRPRPVRSRPWLQLQLPSPRVSPDSDRRVPDSPRKFLHRSIIVGTKSVLSPLRLVLCELSSSVPLQVETCGDSLQPKKKQLSKSEMARIFSDKMVWFRLWTVARLC
ncbi:hypothetical protein NDU88_001124 [Pleurodeles waltl]|uniref:Uncharacterized protein n=1 Tax=Pleurodeles waltl TaxID=8319 RepID=A0AAV7U7I9_PLEWA|nr:hypothetical protein NDU88_001124 [Pleurodeles waltl]